MSVLNISRYMSDGVTATCMCLNTNQEAFVATNSGLVFRYNLGQQKVWPAYYTYENTGNLKNITETKKKSIKTSQF